MSIERKEIAMPSGKTLSFQDPDFEDALNLYQAVLEEAKPIQFNTNLEVGTIIKDVFCTAFSSKKIQACIWKCMEKCLYNGERVTKSTWEPVEARSDYMAACLEVAIKSISPFTKDLFAFYGKALEKLQNHQA